MKWFKHVSDSLDDPMIYSLMSEFGADGYLVFFGVLEKYSREFSPENSWKLVIKLSFFRGKFLISQNKIKKILSKIYKWEITYQGDDVSIYIPKFTHLLDNYTRNNNPIKQDKTCKLIVSPLQETFQPLKNKEERIKNKEEYIHQKQTYTDDFIAFWKVYPKKVGKDAAWRRWRSLNGTRPVIEALVSAIVKQAQSDQWQRDNGQYIPNPATWLHEGRWEDEMDIPESSLDAWARKKQAEMEGKGGTV